METRGCKPKRVPMRTSGLSSCWMGTGRGRGPVPNQKSSVLFVHDLAPDPRKADWRMSMAILSLVVLRQACLATWFGALAPRSESLRWPCYTLDGCSFYNFTHFWGPPGLGLLLENVYFAQVIPEMGEDSVLIQICHSNCAT